MTVKSSGWDGSRKACERPSVVKIKNKNSKGSGPSQELNVDLLNGIEDITNLIAHSARTALCEGPKKDTPCLRCYSAALFRVDYLFSVWSNLGPGTVGTVYGDHWI